MKRATTHAPFLRRIEILPERLDPDSYVAGIPIFHGGVLIELDTPITFIVGENGSGKSTLLEAIA